jgi:hypothetical protein
MPSTLPRVPLPWIMLVALAVVPRLEGQQAPAVQPAFPMPPQYRDIQVQAQETQRTLLLSMVDSMPEEYFRTRAGEGQRDFAQQIHHAAYVDAWIVAHYMLGSDSLPVPEDTARVLNSRAGLRDFVNAAYDFSVRVLQTQDESTRMTPVWFFGRQLPRWMVWDELNQHTIWTAGQIVANFRAHGMPPPAFLYF